MHLNLYVNTPMSNSDSFDTAKMEDKRSTCQLQEDLKCNMYSKKGSEY